MWERVWDSTSVCVLGEGPSRLITVIRIEHTVVICRILFLSLAKLWQSVRGVLPYKFHHWSHVCSNRNLFPVQGPPRNNEKHSRACFVSFFFFYCVLNIYFKHLITVSYLPIYIMNQWAFLASLKPSRQCSCRLYHTEIYIVCQVRDSTKEFIIRPRKVMGFCMCKRFTFIISQPSATEGFHTNPSHYDSLITQRMWHLALSFVIKSLKLHLQQSAERQWMDPFIGQYHHVKTEVWNNF